MNLPEFFARATAFFDKAESQSEKGSAALLADVEKYKLSLEAADKQIIELTTQTTAWADKFSALEAKLTASEKENADLKASAKTAEQIGSIKAAQITAAQGQPPLHLSPEANPAAPKGPELKGLDRTRAALEAEIQKKKA